MRLPSPHIVSSKVSFCAPQGNEIAARREIGDSVKARPVVDVPSIVVIGEWRVVLVLVRRSSGRMSSKVAFQAAASIAAMSATEPSKWKITASW